MTHVCICDYTDNLKCYYVCMCYCVNFLECSRDEARIEIAEDVCMYIYIYTYMLLCYERTHTHIYVHICHHVCMYT